MSTVPDAAGVVLAGGRSRRMGSDKADLPWRGTTLLDHVLGVLRRAVGGPLVVVGAADRPRPLPPGHDDGAVTVVHDPVPGGGPLQGLATGLSAVTGTTSAVVCSVDLPLLRPEYVRAVVAHLSGGAEVALPVLDGHHQPFAAAYATALAARTRALLEAGARRPDDLFAVSAVRRLDAAALLSDAGLRAADPHLHSVRGANTPAELDAARELDAWDGDPGAHDGAHDGEEPR